MEQVPEKKNEIRHNTHYWIGKQKKRKISKYYANSPI